ncbi:MAG: PilN domain-containing protein [Pseudomonadales bacterium]|nr:PilN domain-containing protein [Pseudomonadales bacterium]
MARINLKPWRAGLRAEKQRQFIMVIVGFAIAGLGYILAVDRIIDNAIDNQNYRNSYLQGEIAALDRKIQEIEKLREKRDQLIERMRVIQELQGNRPVIVHLFDELVRTIPDGVYFTKLDRKGELLSIQGKAESNNRISSLMRNLNASNWLEEPNLTSVKAKEEDGVSANDFDLTVKRSIATNGQEG